MFRNVIAAALLAVALGSCATNPVTGGKNVVFGTEKGEKESARRDYQQIIHAYGLYEDQAVQDYVNQVGQKVAKHSHLPDWEFHFTVLDDQSINAFTTGGGYVYVHRGLLTYLGSEAELAAVLGHEIGHNTARHPQRQQTRNVLASVLATGAVIATGSGAVADLANIGAGAWIQGYGRENEMEADRLGLEYATKSGYKPEAMGDVFKVFKAQEAFELNRARAEGREPNIYHGMFSDHPAPDERAVQAAEGVGHITSAPPGGWIENREQYLKAIDGIPYGTSRAQGVVRENRFYHAELGITLAFPHGWTVQNERDRIIAFTPSKDTVMQITADKRPEKKAPREFLLEKLKGASYAGGEALNSNGMEGYALITRSGSPLDNGSGPVRWIVFYRDKSAFVFAGASRSASGTTPEADRLFFSVAETMRGLKPAEFPLAEPYRIKMITADANTKLEDYAKNVPLAKYQKEELQLINGLYPNHDPKPGNLVKIVE
jgi:predicted Zn-dependent protease